MEVRKSRLLILDTRFWKVVGCWLLVFCMLAQSALAVTVDVRIEGPTSQIWQGEVNTSTTTINGTDGSIFNLQPNKAGSALQAAANTGGFSTAYVDLGGLFLTTIAGIKNQDDWSQTWGYRVNYKEALLGLSDQEIKDGDQLLFFYSGWPYPFPLKLKVSKTDPTVDEQFTITTTYFDDSDTTFKPISASVVIGNNNYQTDSDGKVVVSIPIDGTYEIVATKEGYVRSNKEKVVAGKIVSKPTQDSTQSTTQDKPPIIVNKSVRIQSSHKSSKYLKKLQSNDGSFENPATSAWIAIALAAADHKIRDQKTKKGKSQLESLKKYNPKLVTDYARQILAVVAYRKNPRNFGKKNLVWRMRDLFLKKDNNLLNDDNFAALALLAAKTPNRRLVRNILANLIKNQHADGGFSYAKNIQESDVDDTAAAIQTLAEARRQRYRNLSQSIDRAINFLKSTQKDNGGFGYAKAGGQSSPNSMSTAWAIQGIIAAGQNPDNWTKPNGSTPFSYLASCQNVDGSFSYTVGGAKLTLATAYAIPALLGKAWPIR